MNPSPEILQQTQDTINRETIKLLPAIPKALEQLSKMVGLDTVGEKIQNTPRASEILLLGFIGCMVLGVLSIVFLIWWQRNKQYLL